MAKEYWDTCLFIAFLQDKPEEQPIVEAIEALLRRSQTPSSNTILVVSAFVLAELQSRPDYNKERYSIVRDLFYGAKRFVRIVALNPAIADQASRLGESHPGLTPGDAVHVATALAERADVLLTLDGGERRSRGLLRFDGLIGNPPLAIEPPQFPRNSQLKMPDN